VVHTAPVTSDRQWFSSGRVWCVLVGALGLGVVGACGDVEDQALCPVFEEFVVVRGVVQAVDVSEVSAGEAALLAEGYLQRVTRMQEVADGRYSSELDALELAVDDVVRTLASVQEDAEFDAWAPLVEDSLEDVRDASARVVEAIEPSCSPDVTEG
jgi:hypothetical protein